MASRKSLVISENVPLAPLTTLGVGGPARYFVEALTERDVIDALNYSIAANINVFVLGGGSNIVVADAGFDGLVLRVSINGSLEDRESKHAEINDERAIWTVGAGEVWDGFVAQCVGNGLYGVECLSGIPGTIGAAPVQNIGAYGQEVSETIVCVNAIDRQNFEQNVFSNEDCGFAYRKSIFNSEFRDRFIITSVTFALPRHGEPHLTYRDIRERIGTSDSDLAETRRIVLDIRASKSMVIDPRDPNSQSVGSFFKNPIIDDDRLTRLAELAGVASVPRFPAGDVKAKVPAAWLIEKAGFNKGLISGNVGISTNHSLAIINRGGAKAAEIIELKERIENAVAAKFEIVLIPEPIFIGFSQ